MDHAHTTTRYYERWLGREGVLAQGGVTLIRSPERDSVQPGYSAPFHVYALRHAAGIALSYGDRAAHGADRLAAALNPDMDAPAIAALLSAVYGVQASISIKYVHTGALCDVGRARVLTMADRAAYERFFCAANGCQCDDWIAEYFAQMCTEGLCCGVFEGDALVSCTDSPTVPYMANAVREIGINTLPAHRGRGLAAQACALAVRQTEALGMTPLWSTSAGNAASQRLAARVGFAPLGEAVCITLKED